MTTINNASDFLMAAAIQANAALVGRVSGTLAADPRLQHQLAEIAWASAQALLQTMPAQLRKDIGEDS